MTYNYQFESFGEMRHSCLCGSANCSGFLGKRPRSIKDIEAEARSKKKAKPARGLPKPAPADPRNTATVLDLPSGTGALDLPSGTEAGLASAVEGLASAEGPGCPAGPRVCDGEAPAHT